MSDFLFLMAEFALVIILIGVESSLIHKHLNDIEKDIEELRKVRK